MKRRILSAITAIAMATTAMFGMTASASPVIVSDPNGNNSITNADSLYINRYLAGMISPSNLDAVDFDRNGIISAMDSYKVMQFLSSFTQYNVQPVVPQTSNINNNANYFVYNAQTGQSIPERNYMLFSAPLESNTTSTYGTGIIGGHDDRVVDWSKSGVVKILTSKGIGSGFVIGPHTIATAAHCVYSKNTDSAASSIKIRLFNADGTVAQEVNAVESHVPHKYVSDYYDDFPYDYAVLTVDENLSSYYQFDLGVALDSAISNEQSVTSTGFPAVVNGVTVNTSNINQMYSSTGCMIESAPENPRDETRQIYYSNDTTPGNSGGPIYITETYNGQTYKTVVAITTSSPYDSEDYNIGTRITTELLRFFKFNSNF
ncbi:trypsin-like serine protease [Holdemanella sp.]|uniref:trypsin-like serine protease n=1 Tax=Holdemanella sp. TaxID=1971762 RepID=UPI003AF1B747